MLVEEYRARSKALEILALKNERYVLQVKAEFTPLIKKLVNRPLLSSGPLKTLSYIAYRQPISQKRVIEVRGQHAYGHVKMLKEMGLITAERSGLDGTQDNRLLFRLLRFNYRHFDNEKRLEKDFRRSTKGRCSNIIRIHLY
jgi:hypothetical protein